MAREAQVIETFVSLADTLVDDFDVIDFLHSLAERAVELLDVTAAGIMLADGEATLRHAACSSEQMRLVELFELQFREGPCFDAYREVAPVRCGSPDDAREQWPQFAAEAQRSGFVSVSAVPMQLRGDAIGALNLFSASPGTLSDDDVRLAQAMADIATIAILQERAIHDARALSTQLEGALASRVVIEQAKGIIAEHRRVDVDTAFTLLPRVRALEPAAAQRYRAGSHRRHDLA